MLIIRDVTEADREQAVAMMKEFYKSPACLHEVPEEHFHRTITEAAGPNPAVRLMMLEEQEGDEAPRTVGYAHFVVSWNNEAGGQQIWFDEMVFNENARGKGYGTQVFAWMEKEYPDVKRIRMEVTRENIRAIALYERMGYKHLDYYQMCKDFD